MNFAKPKKLFFLETLKLMELLSIDMNIQKTYITNQASKFKRKYIDTTGCIFVTWRIENCEEDPRKVEIGCLNSIL